MAKDLNSSYSLRLYWGDFMSVTDLKNKIVEEMTVNYSNALEKNFDLAKHLVRITQSGKVDVIDKEKLNGKEQILAYLIGKLYAKESGLSENDDADNSELLEELGIPTGSLFPWLKELRESGIIRQVKRNGRVHHTLQVNFLEKTVTLLTQKLAKSQGGL